MSTVAAPGSTLHSPSTKTLVVILLGPPGAGKGTQAKKLKNALKLPHISTGDLLRENIKKSTSLGKEAKGFMDEGKLVPDTLIIDMLFARVRSPDCTNGYILDGFPRTLAQAKAYHERLGKEVKVAAINLELSDEIIIERLSNRVVCSSCSAPFHLKYSPPKVKGICDFCGGTLMQRSDDEPQVIQKRIRVYHEQTAPLIEYYSKEESFKGISCDLPIEDILEEITKYLKSLEKTSP